MMLLTDEEIDLAYDEAEKKFIGGFGGIQWDSTLTGREIAKAQLKKVVEWLKPHIGANGILDTWDDEFQEDWQALLKEMKVC